MELDDAENNCIAASVEAEGQAQGAKASDPVPNPPSDAAAKALHDDSQSAVCVCCFVQHRPNSPAVHSLVAQLDEAYDEASVACGVSTEALSLHVLELINNPGSAEKEGLEPPDMVLEWRRCLRKVRRLRARLGHQEEAHSRLMSIRPGAVRANQSEVRHYQGLYQSMMRLRTNVDSLNKNIVTIQERLQQLESATVALHGQPSTEVCRIRVAHVFYLQRQVCLDKECTHPVHTRKGGAWRWLCRRLRGESKWGQTEGAGIQIVALAPRTSEQAERDSVRDSFSVCPVSLSKP